ncbi:MAG: CPBP family intramembrane glutamic endopeptidase [Balneolaceae bacterium]
MNSAINRYHQQSKGLLYSYLICIPLLLAYEALILISQPGSRYMVRISVDSWFKSVFTYFGMDAISTTLLIAAVIGGFILYRKRADLSHLRKHYFLFMIAESLLYAVLVSLAIGSFLSSLFAMQAGGSIQQLTKLQQLALSLGAGLYEELFFRVILVSLLIYLFNFLFTKRKHAVIGSVLLAALIFSGVHYIGLYGDNFNLNSFLFRFLFGLALNLIYVIRGFGIAAWTHALYDVLIVLSR